jgi:YgiT-type zinc finger domain-containing protein
MEDDKDLEKYRELFSTSGEEPETCQNCDGPLNLEKVNLEDFQGGKLYLMENIPAYVCQSCGEVWVPEPIMHEFEKMIETAQQHHAPAKIKNKPAGKKAKLIRRKGK